MFKPDPSARADLEPGTTYAISGKSGWVYYGQVTSEKNVGFFRYRSRDTDPPEVALGAPVMSVISVNYPSIGRALRAGLWLKLGRFPLVSELTASRPTVQWPTGTLVVTVWSADIPEYDTRVEDPAIQAFERAAVWEADEHIAARLVADFGAEEGEWWVGGPIWRERRVAEEQARRFPDAPWDQLPDDWISTSAD